MESKLKALKVVELKEILSKAQVSVQGKANKADLIAKILSSPSAVKVYEGQSATGADTSSDVSNPTADATQASSNEDRPPHPPSSRPPTATEPAPVPTSPSKTEPLSKPKIQTAATPAAVETVTDTAEVEEDPELAKRQARASRFNIPLVEPEKAKAKQPKTKGAGKSAIISTPEQDDPAKLEERAKRFGLQLSSERNTTAGRPGSKRPAPSTESVDEEELERRRKRAERFGASNTIIKA